MNFAGFGACVAVFRGYSRPCAEVINIVHDVRAFVVLLPPKRTIWD